MVSQMGGVVWSLRWEVWCGLSDGRCGVVSQMGGLDGGLSMSCLSASALLSTLE